MQSESAVDTQVTAKEIRRKSSRIQWCACAQKTSWLVSANNNKCTSTNHLTSVTSHADWLQWLTAASAAATCTTYPASPAP